MPVLARTLRLQSPAWLCISVLLATSASTASLKRRTAALLLSVDIEMISRATTPARRSARLALQPAQRSRTGCCSLSHLDRGLPPPSAPRQAFEECRDIYQSLGYRRGVALAIQHLGGVAYDLGDYARARALFCEGLRIRRDLGLQRGYAYSFEFIADVDEREKRYERAVQLLAAADTLRVRIGAPVEQINQKENEDALTRLRAQLGDVVFELEWTKGATMTTEQAIALALG
jgi:tetratricopeptide (TPR) repeat protein